MFEFARTLPELMPSYVGWNMSRRSVAIRSPGLYGGSPDAVEWWRVATTPGRALRTDHQQRRAMRMDVVEGCLRIVA